MIERFRYLWRRVINRETPEAPVEIKRFSKDQLILPETQIPQEVSDILQRAEQKGIRVFDAYRLSGIMLTQDTIVRGWKKKPEQWYWDNVGNGNISKDAPQLPDTWVLIDRTERPSYSSNGKQLHKNDPFGPLLAKLRKDKKIYTTSRGIPETSRFDISPDDISQVVLPEIAELLEVDTSQVRLPKEIEFNVLGNLVYPKWGKAYSGEWFDDKFKGGGRLVGGLYDLGGLAQVTGLFSALHNDGFAFRPLVVVSPKA